MGFTPVKYVHGGEVIRGELGPEGIGQSRF